MRALLSAFPGMPATLIAERVRWTGFFSWFRERVRAISPDYLPPIRLTAWSIRGSSDPVRPVVRGSEDRGRVRPPGVDPAGAGDGCGVSSVHCRGDAALAPDHGLGGMWQLLGQSFGGHPMSCGETTRPGSDAAAG